MATSEAGKEEDFTQYTCPVCLEIFDRPVVTSCGHTYCTGCMSNYTGVAEPQCPLCRNVFNPGTLLRNAAMEHNIAAIRTRCKGCNRKMALNKIRSHQQACSKMKMAPVPFEPVGQSSQQPRSLPNRSTFICPYCGLRNLDNTTLITHCNEIHRNSNAQVVCPICSSMPWGNPDQTSSNFIQHLNLRHKFEYDTYVDYNQDEDAMLELALKASMMET